MDPVTKKKLIAISIGVLIFMVTYFIIRSKYMKSRPTGYKKTIILHRDGNIKEKITFDETYSNYQMGFFILIITTLFLITAIYLTCFSCGESSSYSMPQIASSISSSMESSVKPLD